MKRNLQTLGALVGLGLLGCSGSGFDDRGSDNLDDGREVSPKAGQFFALSLPSEDSCASTSSASVELSAIDIKVASDGQSFEFIDDDIPVSCAADGKGGFDCALDIEPLDVPELDLKATFDSKLTLKWLSQDRIEGQIEIATKCEGEGCGELEADFPGGLPCSTKASYIAVRTMPEQFVPQVGEYDATVGKPTFTTCDRAPAVAEAQTLRIEAQADGTAKVFTDDDPTPHDCEFEGNGRTVCSRLTEVDGVESFAQVDASWTSATSFEGGAALEVRCAEGADCSGSELGALPCLAIYRIEGVAASKGAAE